MATPNPYAAPRASVEDVREERDDGQAQFTPEGIVVPAGHGWLWIKIGWELFRRQPGTWIGLVLIFGLLSMVMNIVPLVGPLAGLLLMPVFLAGMMLGARALDSEEPLAINHLFQGFKANTGQLVLIGVLQLAAIIVFGVVVGLGAALLGVGDSGFGIGLFAMMVFGLVFLFLWMAAIWFSPALVAIARENAIAAVGASFRGVLKNWRAFLVYGLVGLVISLIMGGVFGAIVGVTGFATLAGVGAGATSMSAFFASFAIAFIAMIVMGAILGPIMIGSIYASFRDIYYES